MRILLLGGDGMLGHKAFRALAQTHEVPAPFLGSRSVGTGFSTDGRVGREWLIDAVKAANSRNVVSTQAQATPCVTAKCVGIIKQPDEASVSLPATTISSVCQPRLAGFLTATGARLIDVSTDGVVSRRMVEDVEGDGSAAEVLDGRSRGSSRGRWPLMPLHLRTDHRPRRSTAQRAFGVVSCQVSRRGARLSQRRVKRARDARVSARDPQGIRHDHEDRARLPIPRWVADA